MSHQTSRKLKNSKLSEVVAYDGGFTAQGSNIESLLNSTSVHKDVSQVSVTSGSANINSGAMTVPGNSIIKSCTVIALEDLDVVNGVAAVNVGVSFRNIVVCQLVPSETHSILSPIVPLPNVTADLLVISAEATVEALPLSNTTPCNLSSSPTEQEMM